MSAASYAILVSLVAFAGAVVAGPFMIAKLRELKMGKRIREEGPESHAGKSGTPTMGGWLMIAVAAVVALVFLRDLRQFLVPLLAMLAFAVYGTLDDLANMRSRSGHGFRVRWKFPIHGAMAFALALLLYYWVGASTVWVPLVGTVDLGLLFIPFAVVVIFSGAAAVNEADGLDGLAGGLSAISYLAYGVIAFALGQNDLAAFCLAVVGAALGFLWFNVNPAKVFMGDTGSLALGAGLGTVALATGQALLLLAIGLVFVIETASVMIQVAYFKSTGGKRVFKMAPLHHHFELSGWTEVQTVQRFWLVGLVAALVGLWLFFL